MQTYSRKIKRMLNQYLAEAYERDLHREVTKLDQSFTEWREGNISSRELSQRIHQYERGPSRELFEQYNHGPADMSVAYAIVVGMLDANEMPAELREALSRPIGFYQSLKDRGDLRERD
jgi:hypothetical protein